MWGVNGVRNEWTRRGLAVYCGIGRSVAFTLWCCSSSRARRGRVCACEQGWLGGAAGSLRDTGSFSTGMVAEQLHLRASSAPPVLKLDVMQQRVNEAQLQLVFHWLYGTRCMFNTQKIQYKQDCVTHPSARQLIHQWRVLVAYSTTINPALLIFSVLQILLTTCLLTSQ